MGRITQTQSNSTSAFHSGRYLAHYCLPCTAVQWLTSSRSMASSTINTPTTRNCVCQCELTTPLRGSPCVPLTSSSGTCSTACNSTQTSRRCWLSERPSSCKPPRQTCRQCLSQTSICRWRRKWRFSAWCWIVVWRLRVTSQPRHTRSTTTPKPSVTSGIYWRPSSLWRWHTAWYCLGWTTATLTQRRGRSCTRRRWIGYVME